MCPLGHFQRLLIPLPRTGPCWSWWCRKELLVRYSGLIGKQGMSLTGLLPFSGLSNTLATSTDA